MSLSDVESDDVEADDVESDDVEAAPIPSMSCKRKRFEEEEGDREDSFEVVYETPMAKIRYNRNKRMHLEMVSEASGFDSIVPESPDIVDKTPVVTPPPVW